MQIILACLLSLTLCFSTSLYADDRESEIKILQKGVKFSLIAEHPDLVTPTGVDVDEQGRIWVVASHTHFPPDDYSGPKFDEILIFDQGKRSVFYNHTHHTMDLELGPDGWVYLAERSRVLRIKDRDGDGEADLVEDLITLKTEADYPHNGLAGLTWDLNGDLIFCLGENYSKPWTMTSTDQKQLQGSSEGGVFRIKPDGTGLKRIARGLWNPFGISVRKNGEFFAVDNDPGERPPCRLLQIVQDGDYGFQRIYGSEAHHPFVCWNGELRGTLPMVHPVGEAPCGMVSFRQGLLSPSWGDHHVCFYHLKQNGAGYTAKPVYLVRGSRYFRPACITDNPYEKNGSVHTWYLTDWVDGRYNVHGYGRLWKLEIDTEKADWIGPSDIEPPNEKMQLSHQIRSSKKEFPLDQLLDYSLDQDPYLAQAALSSLTKLATNWTTTDFETQSVEKQVQFVLALKNSYIQSPDSIDQKKWIPFLLSQNNHVIKQETLRWISDAQLIEYFDDVNKILDQPDLVYELFEAAIATWNTLDGKPESGLRNEKLLLEQIQNPHSSPKIRTYALRLLPAQIKVAKVEKQLAQVNFPKGLTLKLLEELIQVGDLELSLEAVRTLSGNPALGEKILSSIAMNHDQPVPVRAEAIAGLAATAENHVDDLLKLATDENREIREEALRSLRSTSLTEDQKKQISTISNQFPESSDLAEVILNPELLTKNRPSFEDLAGWEQQLASVPGEADIQTGKRLFHHAKIASCSVCHRNQGRGNTVGPDLSSVHTRNDKNWLLKSILQPSLEMSPEFRPSMILLKDGRTFTGIRLQSYTKEAIRDNKGLKRVFDRSDIELIKDLDQSFMPNGVAHLMTDRELRDLVGFLNSKNK